MIGTRIAQEREKLHLTQAELASRVNVSQKSISKYERGDRRPTFETIAKMAELFEVSVDYLIGTESNNKKNSHGANLYLDDVTKRIINNCKQLNEKGKQYVENQTIFALQQEEYLSEKIAKKEA